ncbi:CHASE2 domain-containing protein [Lusitaniella coriacea LEGE 07157]|uniref:CHASE2 domain-containing protein n=1 Tax=Lusitaniella coriacea LEGE 07157 TaxID=945747 RepID=A0A8J7DZV5_9CYAN|nr:CHASE2 domain-containing protein [Lusitaniella coriacea LEGE 07157]
MVDFELTVRKFEQTCVFELSWGRGQHLSATLDYSNPLSEAYQNWQHVYLSYYQSSLRGWIEASGNLTQPPVDWHGKLVQAEAKLLSDFHHWLRSAELFEIRTTIGNHRLLSSENAAPSTANLFLTCTEMELERLPWETWEIGAEFPTTGLIRIARVPLNIRHATISPVQPPRKRKARVLTILGDETGLNFQGDKAAIQALAKVAEVEFVGGKPGESRGELKAKICNAIADEQGWDILLFAGHSNETVATGGEFAIAPQISLSFKEIRPQLLAAKERGLQFALFNSCNGLSLARSLIDLGLSQVAIMREPICDDVAQVFLLQFLQSLAECKDVHDCLLAASALLKQSKNLTYPSAYLIPSLFCHPGAKPFQIHKKPQLWQRFQPLIPAPKEAIALSILTLLSLSLPVQDRLLEQRVKVQAMYRQFTGQLPPPAPPPVLLVQIDEQSIQKAGMSDPVPMNRTYLASLVDALVEKEARIIGIDYLLDRPQKMRDRALAKSLQTAVQNPTHPVTFVLATVQDDDGSWLRTRPEIASPNWSLQGHIHLWQWNMRLLPPKGSRDRAAPTLVDRQYPFSYLLALAQKLQQDYPKDAALKPDLNSSTDFLEQLIDNLKREQKKNHRTLFSPAAQMQPITIFSYSLGQMWLHPIIDFSIPPQQVYDTLPAWHLLENKLNSQQLDRISQKILIIVPKYSDAGIDFDGQDNFPLPAALRYWFKQDEVLSQRKSITGGEVHAYMVDRYLQKRLVVPLPDLWFLGIGIILGKSLFVLTKKNKIILNNKLIFISTIGVLSIVYGIVSLQLYMSNAIILPWLFPTLVIGIYLLSFVTRNKK